MQFDNKLLTYCFSFRRIQLVIEKNCFQEICCWIFETHECRVYYVYRFLMTEIFCWNTLCSTKMSQIKRSSRSRTRYFVTWDNKNAFATTTVKANVSVMSPFWETAFVKLEFVSYHAKISIPMCKMVHKDKGR